VELQVNQIFKLFVGDVIVQKVLKLPKGTDRQESTFSPTPPPQVSPADSPQ